MADTVTANKLTPKTRYQQDLASGSFVPDDAQASAIEALETLYLELVDREESQSDSRLWSKIKKTFQNTDKLPLESIKGIYFWGGVGRGKTYLVDAFFDCLPFERKIRLHFHRFMQRVHNDLTARQGQENPLEAIAEQLSKEASVLCLDEFFVKDITDAMLLAGLLRGLFARGVVLVTTSNIEPKDLYKDGLQRQRFLPAIDLLELNTQVINLDGGVDYRLRALKQAELYHYPLDDSAETSLQESFASLAPEQGLKGKGIEVLGREIVSKLHTDDVIWFDFKELCDGPRSQNDYIEISRVYHAVLISNVPLMGEKTDDLARRFINLVDEFYDRNVKLILSAEASIDKLYSGGRLQFEFERTQSRLLEMQSHEYLAKEHLS